MKLLKKEKGATTLIMLFFMIFIIIVASLFIDISITYGTVDMVRGAADSAAKLRAEAIDVPLKELTGYIEVLHPDPSIPGKYDDNVDHLSIVAAPGNIPPDNPASPEYQYAELKADDAAKQAAVDYLNAELHNNLDHNPMIPNFDQNNICVDIKPLPPTSQDVTFSCQTKLGNITETTYVNGLDKETFSLGPNENESVKNVVFVGIIFQYNFFITNALRNWGLTKQAPNVTVWRVSYPGIDSCSRAYASTGCP